MYISNELNLAASQQHQVIFLASFMAGKLTNSGSFCMARVISRNSGHACNFSGKVQKEGKKGQYICHLQNELYTETFT